MLKKSLVSLLVGISIVGLVGCGKQEFKDRIEERKEQVQEERQEEQSKEENYEKAYQLLKGCVEESDNKFTIDRKGRRIYLKLNTTDPKMSDLYNDGWTAEEIENKYGSIKDSTDHMLASAKSKTEQYDVVVVAEISYSDELIYATDTTGKVSKDIFEEIKEIEKKAQKEAEEEAKRKDEEEKANSHIGETIKFTRSGCINPGDFNLTIDNVYLTDERNMFADPVKYVVVIEYTVESININDLDFFLDNNANFYDSNGYKCKTYPNVSNKSTYDIDKGMKAKGQFSIGITESDTPYLEMKYGGIEYKWNL